MGMAVSYWVESLCVKSASNAAKLAADGKLDTDFSEQGALIVLKVTS